MLSMTNYTQFPNWLLDSIHLYHPVQWKIISLIVRKNIGYSGGGIAPSKEFSYRYIAKKLNVPKSTIQHHLKFLIASGQVVVVGRGKRGILKLDIPDRPGYRTETPAPYHPSYSTVQGPGQNCTGEAVRFKENELQQISVQEPALSEKDESISGKVWEIKNHMAKNTESQDADRVLNSLENKISSGSFEMVQEFLSGRSESLPEYLMELLRRNGYREFTDQRRAYG